MTKFNISLASLFFYISHIGTKSNESIPWILFRTRTKITRRRRDNTQQSTTVGTFNSKNRCSINYLSAAGTFVSTWESAQRVDRENSHCELNGCGTRRSREFPRGPR